MKQFEHCTQCELCTIPEIINTYDVSANTTQLAMLNEMPRSEKRKTFGTKMELNLKVLRDIDLDALRARLLKAITFALKEEFGSDFISVQIISLEVKTKSIGEAEDAMKNRKRREDEIEEFMEIFVVIFIKLFVKIEDEQIPGITEKIEKEVMLIDMLKSVKIIPLNKDTVIYFWFQMIILLATIFIFIYSTVKRHKLNSAVLENPCESEKMVGKLPLDQDEKLADDEDLKVKENGDDVEGLEEVEANEKSEDRLYFFLICFIHFFLPVMDIYPSVYVWYDYETNTSLAFTPRSFKFTILLLGFVVVKLMFFIWNTMVLNEVIADPEFISRNRLVYRLSCRGVSGGVLPYLCIDGIQSVLIYFYFTRFILPGEIISDGAYLCLAFAVLKENFLKTDSLKRLCVIFIES